MTPRDEFSPTKAMVSWMQAIVPYGIFMTDPQLRIRSWNDWLIQQSGLRAEDVLGRNLIEVYPSVAARQVDKHYARALRGEICVLSTALHKYLLPFPSGVERSAPYMLQTVRIAPLTEEGEVIGTITVIEDVTQREVQAGLLGRQRELERQLSSALAILLQSGEPGSETPRIFASIAPALGLDAFLNYRLDAEGRNLVLQSSAGLPGGPRELIASLPLSEESKNLLRTSADPIGLNLEGHVERLRHAGWQAVYSFPLAVGERLFGMIVLGTYQRAAISAADISILARLASYLGLALDRSLRERETVDASRAKDDFLAALSHELRTPLYPVLLIASESESNPEFPPEAREAFRIIEKNVLLEARLIDDLLDLTRIEHGKLALETERVDLHTTLLDAAETVRADMVRSELTVKVALTAEPHVVIGDAGRLQQVFWNVLMNAVKFTPAGGRIHVSTAVDSETREIAVVISDTGIGMSEAELARVFSAFAQGDHSMTGGSHRFGGLGLGLAICRKLVESHRGRILAASAGKNQGATFTVYLPLAPVTSPPRPQQDPGAGRTRVSRMAESKRGRILLIEDHEPSRTALGYLLKRRGFSFVAADSAAAALAAAETDTFDLIISDIGLPDMDGFELMTRLKTKSHAPRIALTGYGMENDLARSASAGFEAHLTKPITVEALDRALARVFPKDKA